MPDWNAGISAEEMIMEQKMREKAISHPKIAPMKIREAVEADDREALRISQLPQPEEETKGFTQGFGDGT